jgi:TPR repeat protein
LANELGEGKKAFKVIKKLLKREPNNDDVVFAFAYTCNKVFNNKKALEIQIKLYKRLANKGDAIALNNLAALYMENNLVSESEVFNMFLKAANNGSSIAKSNVGLRYIKGKGVEVDYKKAFDWLTASANDGDENGVDGLGYCYYNGFGVTKNVNKAIESWLTKKDFYGCQIRLAWAYHFDLKKYDKAKEFYKLYIDTVTRKNIIEEQSENYGNANANLGSLYVDTKYYEKAYDYFKEGAKYNNKTCIHNLGWLYERGYGVSKDIDMANYWYDLEKSL